MSHGSEEDVLHQHRDRSYSRFTELLLKSKATEGLQSKHFWIITVLIFTCTFIYYIDQTFLTSKFPFHYSFFTSVHDGHRTLFLVPIIYAALTFRVRGVLLTSFLFLCIMMPRSLLFSPYPDPLLRPLLFAAAGLFISWLVATQLNYIEYQLKAVGDIKRLSGEVKKLEEQRKIFLSFLGMAAHDLKSPLAAIQSYFGVMLGGFSGKLDEKQEDMVKRSSVRVIELIDLIDDLLYIPRIETGQILGDMSWFSLEEEIEHCIDGFRSLAEEKGIELRTEIPEKLNKVYGSAPDLRRAITNLLDNAISYTPEGIVRVKVTEENSDIRIETNDDGIGIPQKELPLIFDDFYRASNVKGKGTGLGLSIVRRIAEAHGGKVQVESPCPETNRGSKFSIVLPKRREMN